MKKLAKKAFLLLVLFSWPDNICAMRNPNEDLGITGAGNFAIASSQFQVPLGQTLSGQDFSQHSFYSPITHPYFGPMAMMPQLSLRPHQDMHRNISYSFAPHTSQDALLESSLGAMGSQSFDTKIPTSRSDSPVPASPKSSDVASAIATYMRPSSPFQASSMAARISSPVLAKPLSPSRMPVLDQSLAPSALSAAAAPIIPPAAAPLPARSSLTAGKTKSDFSLVFARAQTLQSLSAVSPSLRVDASKSRSKSKAKTLRAKQKEELSDAVDADDESEREKSQPKPLFSRARQAKKSEPEKEETDSDFDADQVISSDYENEPIRDESTKKSRKKKIQNRSEAIVYRCIGTKNGKKCTSIFPLGRLNGGLRAHFRKCFPGEKIEGIGDLRFGQKGDTYHHHLQYTPNKDHCHACRFCFRPFNIRRSQHRFHLQSAHNILMAKDETREQFIDRCLIGINSKQIEQSREHSAPHSHASASPLAAPASGSDGTHSAPAMALVPSGPCLMPKNEYEAQLRTAQVASPAQPVSVQSLSKAMLAQSTIKQKRRSEKSSSAKGKTDEDEDTQISDQDKESDIASGATQHKRGKKRKDVFEEHAEKKQRVKEQ